MKRLLTYLVLLLSALTARGQEDSVAVAISSLQEGNLGRARVAIDHAAYSTETGQDPQTWYLRGFIYKEIFNKLEKGDRRSPARDTAFHSFTRSIALDEKKEHAEDNQKNLKYLAATYFNDAKESMTPEGHEDALWTYTRFTECMKAYDPSYDPTLRDIEFKNALASLYNRIYDQDQEKNAAYFDKVKELYMEVLATDSNNVSANYNLGILFYNKAVNIINNMDYDMDMFAFMEVQEKCVDIFKESLPFMEKAYELDPKRKETLIGLSGIYFSLHEIEKSEEIKRQIAELEKK